MRAALIREVGAAPELVADHPGPEGEVVVDVTAAPINPVDLSIAAGRFYAGPPNPPYVPGVEGVGRTAEGARLWFETGAGYLGDGSMAERAVVHLERAVELPDGVDDAVAGCLGVAGIAAWVPLANRACVEEGETVLILGATGVVGQIGVQAAKLLGAGRVIAAGRDPEKLAAVDADAHVRLPATADELREAGGGGDRRGARPAVGRARGHRDRGDERERAPGRARPVRRAAGHARRRASCAARRSRSSVTPTRSRRPRSSTPPSARCATTPRPGA